MSCRVWNVKEPGVPLDAVYVGRRTPYGNRFIIGVHGDRAEVLAKFRAWCHHNPWFVERISRELFDKNLVCDCKPLDCHADILFEIANEL